MALFDGCQFVKTISVQVIAAVVICFVLFSSVTVIAETQGDRPSVSHGTTSDGWLENGKPLPDSGPNFRVYSKIGSLLGRTYVHSSVKAAVLDAYSSIHHEHPEYVYVFGETGWEKGGRFRPHKTHRNGLSVDFMVPVRNEYGKSVSLPCSVFNKLGYAIEFDDEGKTNKLNIDFESIAVHLMALENAAHKNGLRIERVIFAPSLQVKLFDGSEGRKLKGRMKFSTKPSWVRHDEHYHVDFGLK